MVPPDAEAVMGQPKWTGLVHVTGDHAVIGNTVGNHLAPVSLTPDDGTAASSTLAYNFHTRAKRLSLIQIV